MIAIIEDFLHNIGQFFTAIGEGFLHKIDQFFTAIGEVFTKTKLPEQIHASDFHGLLHNPWFMLPLIALIGYLLYKKLFRDLIILSIFLGIWYVSKLPYMQTLVINGILQINKVLVVMVGGGVLLGIVIYLFFGRSD